MFNYITKEMEGNREKKKEKDLTSDLVSMAAFTTGIGVLFCTLLMCIG